MVILPSQSADGSLSGNAGAFISRKIVPRASFRNGRRRTIWAAPAAMPFGSGGWIGVPGAITAFGTPTKK
jgi:hypothetical protein